MPSVQTGMSEADLNKFCRKYLQALVDNNLAVGFLLYMVLHIWQS